MGVVASMVLRCHDCLTSHLVRCREEGMTEEEFSESISITLVLAGSIVIPHLRRAVDTLYQHVGDTAVAAPSQPDVVNPT